jgi:hypothetical protein
MRPGESSPPKPDGREPKQDGEDGEARERGGPGESSLSPALLRAVAAQLFSHRHQLGRHERMDLLGARYGWTREVREAPLPVEPAGLDA